jgi:hypothetical protein
MLCLIQRDEHLFSQVEGRRFLTCSSSINLTFQVSLLLGGYSTSASGDALYLPRRIDPLEARFCYLTTRPPFGRHTDLPRRCVGVS